MRGKIVITFMRDRQQKKTKKMTKKLLPSQNKLRQREESERSGEERRSELQLREVKSNTEIFEPVNYLPEIAAEQENLKPTAEILQAVLLQEEPKRSRSGLSSEKFLTPLSVTGAILFIGANILVGINIVGQTSSTEITNPQQAPEAGNVANVPNLAAEELVKLNSETIITIKPKTKVAAAEPIAATNNVKEIPGAYSDLASSLLPPSVRPLTKVYATEDIYGNQSQAEVK